MLGPCRKVCGGGAGLVVWCCVCEEEDFFSSLLQSLVVANGGLGNGVSREELSTVLKEMGEVEALLMPPHKPYAFVTYRYS